MMDNPAERPDYSDQRRMQIMANMLRAAQTPMPGQNPAPMPSGPAPAGGGMGAPMPQGPVPRGTSGPMPPGPPMR
jgi:hypothetical protein